MKIHNLEFFYQFTNYDKIPIFYIFERCLELTKNSVYRLNMRQLQWNLIEQKKSIMADYYTVCFSTICMFH